MQTQTTSDWLQFQRDGKRYYEIVKKAVHKDNKFTPEILYNMACMGIEKLFMAYFLKAKKMPTNHTLLDLVLSIKELQTIPAELEKNLLFMNDFQEICSIEQYNRKIPTQNDLESFITTMGQTDSYIQGLVQAT